jgi:hypothetical protein
MRSDKNRQKIKIQKTKTQTVSLNVNSRASFVIISDFLNDER